MKKDAAPQATNNLRTVKKWPSWDETADIIAQFKQDKKDSFRGESSDHFTKRASKQGE